MTEINNKLRMLKTNRKLFCEISPFTYRLSMEKEILRRHLQDLIHKTHFALERTEASLSVLVYRHNSLIRRRLGNVNMQLQENKATNLSLAVKHIDGLLIRPGETFSVWKLIGRTTKRKGYKEGLTIAKGQPSQGIGGGLCQLSNLIHWLVLHSELTITEHHHHDGLDLFPDFGRQIPFGTGTSISYNYIDYRVKNETTTTYQLRLWVDDEYLCGELRSEKVQPHTFHIHAENEYFSREDGVVYRNGEVFRDIIDRKTGQCLESQLIRINHAKVMYDCPSSLIREMSTKSIRLRPWQESDAQALYKYASDPEVGPRAGWPPHQSVEESMEIIRTVFNAEGTISPAHLGNK